MDHRYTDRPAAEAVDRSCTDTQASSPARTTRAAALTTTATSRTVCSLTDVTLFRQYPFDSNESSYYRSFHPHRLE